jgi:glycosyltransferase involved in cell wall biosynthesis
VTSYFLTVLPALVEAGVHVTTCFLREPHPAAEALRDHGVTPVFLSKRRMDPSAVVDLAAIARRNGCTVLHAAGIKATLMARMATRLVPARTILHLHDLLVPPFAVRGLQRTFARRTDMAVCVSRAATPIAERCYHVSPDRVRVIHNGIRLDPFRAVPADAGPRIRETLGIGEGTRVIGMVGRMHPVKGHSTMLRMLPRIVQSCPDVMLLLAGDGPERGRCEALVGSLGLRRHVKFLGQRSDVAQVLAACDLTVMPSESEGLPIAAIESLAMAKPVVAFDVGGVRDVIDDKETGRVVPAGDSDAFVGAVLPLLLDEQERNAYGARAWSAAERFTIDIHVRQLLGCYRELSA